MSIYIEGGARNMLEGEMGDESATRWGSWEKEDTVGQWDWLRELGLLPRRLLVMGSTEEPGRPKIDEIENDIPESIDGIEERFGCRRYDEGAVSQDSRRE